MVQKAIIPIVSNSFVIPNLSSLKTISDKIKFSETGGLMIKLTNRTGAPTVKGSVVSSSPDYDNSFHLQSNEFDAIGVVLDDGIPDGNEAYVIVSGIAEVLFKVNVTATRGYVALSADTDGFADNIDVPSSNPVVAQHFKEIGHVLETKVPRDQTSSVLAKVMLHFN
jgi:hypothetical protein